MYQIFISKRAVKEKALLKQANLDKKVKTLLAILQENPFQNPPSYEKLSGDLAGLYSRRINHQHRLVYAVDKEKNEVRILSMWTHYE